MIPTGVSRRTDWGDNLEICPDTYAMVPRISLKTKQSFPSTGMK